MFHFPGFPIVTEFDENGGDESQYANLKLGRRLPQFSDVFAFDSFPLRFARL